MQPGTLFKKLFRIAFITSPFFGLFGASPGLAAQEFGMERVLHFFFFITVFTFFLWLINILLVIFFYKDGFQKNNILRYIISIAICAGTVYMIFLIFPSPPINLRIVAGESKIPLPFMHHKRLSFMHIMPILQGLSINTILIVLTELLILKDTKLKVDTENEQLKLFNLEAKNSQLKQQLHPHFLFNSLSTLRSLIRRSPEKAEEYLERLSELLRFSTNNSNQSLVTLKEEVELCTNYLAMQQTRFGDALLFTIDIPGTVQQNGEVPVFALQQLAENAIKHNVLTKEQPLFIKILVDEKNEWIIIKNNLRPKQTIDPSTGVGLANLSERYRLTGSNDIVIKNDDGNFSVAIKILEHAGNNN
jgi:two-component system, LytTR family, sensor kinase